MLGKPKYEYDQEVFFKINDTEYKGRIYIIDAYGTFFQNKEVSYDIFVETDKGRVLFKHITEPLIYTC